VAKYDNIKFSIKNVFKIDNTYDITFTHVGFTSMEKQVSHNISTEFKEPEITKDIMINPTYH